MAKTEIKWMICCAALATGEACAFFCGPLVALWPAVAAAAALVVLFGYGAKIPCWPVAAVFLLSFAAAARGVSSERKTLDAIDVFCCGMAEADIEVSGDASEWTGRDGGRRVSFPGRIGTFRTKVILFGADAVPRKGETWRCRGWLSRKKEGDRFPRTLVVKGKGSSASRVLGEGALAAFERRLEAAKRDIARRMAIGLDSKPGGAAVNRAMMLGERRSLSPEDREVFSAAGTVHVFAVSGLHVMALAWGVRLAFFFVPARFAALFVAPVLFLYVLMVGSPPSAVRAALAATLYFAAPMFWRRPNAVVALSMAFVAIGVLRPLSLSGAGAMYSFSVTLSLVMFARCLARRGGAGVLLAFFAAPAVAWAAGTPISARMFGMVSLGGLVANAAVVPAAAFAVAACAAGVAASFVSPAIASHANNLAALVTGCMASASRAVASVPFCRVEVEPWPVWLCVAWYAALLAAMFFFSKKLSLRVGGCI